MPKARESKIIVSCGRVHCHESDFMAETGQPCAMKDAADNRLEEYAFRRGRMNSYQTEDIGWAVQQMHQRVSFSGWFFAMISGLCLWALMIRLVI